MNEYPRIGRVSKYHVSLAALDYYSQLENVVRRDYDGYASCLG